MQSQGARKKKPPGCWEPAAGKFFGRVTLPNIKWGLLYGIILCNARAMGEFGAVSVVSGHIRGETNTMPLQVEVLYNEYNVTAAFAVASLLAMLALVTLILKSLLEWKVADHKRRRSTSVYRRLTMSIEARNISKSFGAFTALERRQPFGQAAANWWPCWVLPARARRRCCGSSPGWSSPTGAAGRSSFTKKTSPGAAWATAKWVSSSSTTPCSAT